jgi:hypothetical protein
LIHSSESTLSTVTTNGDSHLIDIRLLWADILAASKAKGYEFKVEKIVIMPYAGGKTAAKFRTKLA